METLLCWILEKIKLAKGNVHHNIIVTQKVDNTDLLRGVKWTDQTSVNLCEEYLETFKCFPVFYMVVNVNVDLRLDSLLTCILNLYMNPA